MRLLYMNRTKYLIIGSGIASVSAIESIRKTDGKSSLTVLTKEKTAFYSRPLISYWLSGEINIEKIQYRQLEFIEEKAVNLIAEIEAKEFDFKKKIVTCILKNGKKEKILYEKMLIATGGKPFVPNNIKNLSNVFTFTTLHDAKKIDSAIKSGAKTASVIGGGFIGLKTAEALKKRGVDVSIVEMAGFVLPTLLDERSSEIFQENIRANGVKMFVKDVVEEPIGGGKKLKLKSGKILDSDIIIAAIGVKPEISTFESTDLKIEKGVVVDKFMQTNIQDVYAAGDVSEAKDFIAKKNRPIPIWSLAYRQGAIAGENMTGSRTVYHGGIPMNSIEIFGLPVISAGKATPEKPSQSVLFKSDEISKKYKKLVFEDERLVGYIMLGDVERAGIYTGLIRSRTDVSKFRYELIGENFGFISVGEETWKKKITPIEV